MEINIEKAVKKSRRRLKSVSYRVRFYELLKNYVVTGRMAFPEVFRKLAKRKRERNNRDAIIFESLKALVDEKNVSVFDALAMMLPREEIMLLESSPREDMSMGFDQLIKLAKSKSDITNAVIVSVGMGFLSIVSGIPSLLFQLSIQVPEYLQILPEEHWPEISHFSLFLYKLLIVHYWVIPVVIVIIIGFTIYTLSRPSFVLRRTLDILPPWSIQRGIQSSSFMVGLGTLLNQRIAFPSALEKLLSVSPNYMRLHLEKMEERMEENMALEDVIDTGFVPRDRMDYIEDFVDQVSFSRVLLDEGEDEIKKLPGKIKSLMLTMMTLVILTIFGLNIYVSFSGQQVGIAYKEYYENGFRR
ncbi:hypothetical protein AB835_08105 [Candidatus Endobugula sertula]|uniref:Type II secretion system protein GspF domain-containing protein n=1 Tax=Candidatus Endobugula sertula TaxID=62101 RepID=A0A1D2QPR3_9GAMM|nr:hypothetical protein AB835_08105 [Candidatus Endobugula sertula]